MTKLNDYLIKPFEQLLSELPEICKTFYLIAVRHENLHNYSNSFILFYKPTDSTSTAIDSEELLWNFSKASF